MLILAVPLCRGATVTGFFIRKFTGWFGQSTFFEIQRILPYGMRFFYAHPEKDTCGNNAWKKPKAISNLKS